MFTREGIKLQYLEWKYMGGLSLVVLRAIFWLACHCEGEKNKSNIEINKKGYRHKENYSILRRSVMFV